MYCPTADIALDDPTDSGFDRKAAAMSDELSGLTIRLMDAQDLDRGFLEVINALRPVILTKQQAVDVYRHRLKSRIRTYVVLIEGRIAGTASVFIEPKFIHSGGIVAHIEDVVVRADSQQHGIGRTLVNHLLEECRKFNCYKVILDCSEAVMPFYEKLGFHRWERAMRMDLETPPPATGRCLNPVEDTGGPKLPPDPPET